MARFQWIFAFVISVVALLYVVASIVFNEPEVGDPISGSTQPPVDRSPLADAREVFTDVDCRLDLCVGFPGAERFVRGYVEDGLDTEFNAHSAHLEGRFRYDLVRQQILTDFTGEAVIRYSQGLRMLTLKIGDDGSVDRSSANVNPAVRPNCRPGDASCMSVNVEAVRAAAIMPERTNAAANGRVAVTLQVAPTASVPAGGPPSTDTTDAGDADPGGAAGSAGSPSPSAGGLVDDVMGLVTQNIANFLLFGCGLLILILGAIRFLGPARQSALAEKYIAQLSTFTAGAVTTILSVG